MLDKTQWVLLGVGIVCGGWIVDSFGDYIFPRPESITAELQRYEREHLIRQGVSVPYQVSQDVLIAALDAKAAESDLLRDEMTKVKAAGVATKIVRVTVGHTELVDVTDPCVVDVGDTLSQEVTIIEQETSHGVLALVGVGKVLRMRKGESMTLIEQPLHLSVSVEQVSPPRLWRVGVIGGINTRAELGYGLAATIKRGWATWIGGGLYNTGHVQIFVGMLF